MDLCFGERDNSTVVPGEKGEKWSNPIAETVSPSYLDGVEQLQEGSEHLMLQWEHLMLQWKHSVVNPSGLITERKIVVYWSAHLYLNGILMIKRSWR